MNFTPEMEDRLRKTEDLLAVAIEKEQQRQSGGDPPAEPTDMQARQIARENFRLAFGGGGAAQLPQSPDEYSAWKIAKENIRLAFPMQPYFTVAEAKAILETIINTREEFIRDRMKIDGFPIQTEEDLEADLEQVRKQAWKELEPTTTDWREPMKIMGLPLDALKERTFGVGTSLPAWPEGVLTAWEQDAQKIRDASLTPEEKAKRDAKAQQPAGMRTETPAEPSAEEIERIVQENLRFITQ